MAVTADGTVVDTVWGEAKDLFSQGMSAWLQYESIQKNVDFAGGNQKAVQSTPEMVHPDPEPTPATTTKTVAGVPVTYIAVGGLAAVALFALLKD